ncbi:hypothetical protein F0562_000706 [Nyssa sinensis]|uniref:Transposase MuDR plant domain-containing protein n=1 Tax=Nyssa sinensis TaxID=561372 RepID=A0A5J5C562_9ASTE|nr:hypothetical protein F0562_000706 [Nyssa sinensis]
MVNTISNVDPDKYSYIKLLQDVGELSLFYVSTVIGFAINLYCDILSSNDRMIISSDLDVLKMFEVHNSREINIYVTTTSAIPCHTVDVNETVTISSHSSEYEIRDSDDVYGLTFEDKAFVPSLCENLKNSTFNIVASPSVNVEVHDGDDLSDFESNDDAEYNPSSEGKQKGDKIVLKLGQLFENVDKFREVLRDYTIQQGCSIIRDKNEKAKVTAHCADSSWETIKINPNIKVDAMQTYLQKTYGIEASKMELYRAKRRALDEIEGKHGSPYTILPMYASEIRRTNLSSLVKIECQRPSLLMHPLFKRIFIASETLFKGFKVGFRPFIEIDGCHLKGSYDGVLLVVVSLDGNNGTVSNCCESG